jgi:hypothetical protein
MYNTTSFFSQPNSASAREFLQHLHRIRALEPLPDFVRLIDSFLSFHYHVAFYNSGSQAIPGRDDSD